MPAAMKRRRVVAIKARQVRNHVDEWSRLHTLQARKTTVLTPGVGRAQKGSDLSAIV